MPPNNLRAFDDGLDGIEDQDSDQIDENASSDEHESIISSKEDKSNNTDEKTTDDSESSETNSSGDLSLEQDDNHAKPAKYISAIAAATSAYLMEKHRQKRLTKVPLVMGQIPKSSRIESIFDQLTNGDGILSQPIVPSLFVGTRGQLASSIAFMSRGPHSELRFSEVLASSYDGAEILLDWEIPQTATVTFNTRKNAILGGSISDPTILILHGINNSSDFGYIKSLQNTMTNRGWNAVAMSFRGAARGGRQPMTTPRSYTAAYTGDLRSVVQQLVSRMKPSDGSSSKCPLFLVGNSLGGLLVTKYLGEEGLAGTLPENVLGGISLGNPFSFHSNRLTFPFGIAIGAARKYNYLCQRKAMSMNRNESSSQSTNVHKDPLKITLASLDKALAPTMVRTALHPPFQTKIGYGHIKNSHDNVPRNTSAATPEEEYWADSSCYKQGRHVSVPLLHVVARDDSLCYPSARSFLGYSLQNPNAIVVQTRTGGHLGWWHKPNEKSKSDSWWGLDSWADGATADFIQAVMDTQKGIAHTSAAAIDDAHNLFTPKKVDGSDASDARMSVSETLSMRPVAGDRDGSSTIATSDHSSNEEIRRSPHIPLSNKKPSKTYFKFQRILLSQNQWEEEQQVLLLERNRFLERRESQESLRLLRSRL